MHASIDPLLTVFVQLKANMGSICIHNISTYIVYMHAICNI